MTPLIKKEQLRDEDSQESDISRCRPRHEISSRHGHELAGNDEVKNVEALLEIPGLADALDIDRFKPFLDHAPFAVAVSKLYPSERLTYANLEFDRLTGTSASVVQGRPWNDLPIKLASTKDGSDLAAAVSLSDDYLGTFSVGEIVVDAWSSTIEVENGVALFRLVALAQTRQEELSRQVEEKDTQLRELQHRVKNNLQMITALIRLEAKNQREDETGASFSKLAGRVESLPLLYRSLSTEGRADSIDLGV